jgi:Cu/Ag efflux pump CusA
MFERLVRFVIAQRWLVMLAVAAMAALGMFNALRCPSTRCRTSPMSRCRSTRRRRAIRRWRPSSASPIPVERMAGLPGLEQTRSLSRYGLSQVTVVFRDGTDIYFARQLVASACRTRAQRCRPGSTPTMGPIATGLGEIFMWTVEAEPGAQARRQPYTPTDLREIQDWVIKPQLRNVPGVTEINTIGGYAKEYVVAPTLERLSSARALTWPTWCRARAQQRQRGRRLHRSAASSTWCARRARCVPSPISATSCWPARGRADPHARRGGGRYRPELRSGAATRTAGKWCWARSSC